MSYVIAASEMATATADVTDQAPSGQRRCNQRPWTAGRVALMRCRRLPQRPSSEYANADRSQRASMARWLSLSAAIQRLVPATPLCRAPPVRASRSEPGDAVRQTR